MHRKTDVILRNLHGTEAFLTCTGASLTGLTLPGDGGQFVNVALTPRGPCDPSCAGATLAPYAGRLRGGLLRRRFLGRFPRGLLRGGDLFGCGRRRRDGGDLRRFR